MFLHVIRAHPLKAYVLRIDFSDGTTKDIDLTDELHGEVFEPLRDPSVFLQARVNDETRTVEWPVGKLVKKTA
jgi:hypothetical protein